MFISFGYLSKNMLISLFIPIVYIIRHYILEKIYKGEEKSVFLNPFIAVLSYSLNIILLIIENRSLKTRKKSLKNKEFKNQLIIEKKKMDKIKKIKRIIIILLLSIYNFCNYQIYDLAKIFKPEEYIKYYFYSSSITVFFLSSALMSYLILGTKIYRHQKLSMIISPILSFIMLFIFIKNFSIKFIDILYLCLCLLLINFRFILMVFGKLFMEKYFISQIKLLSFFGIFGLLFSLIVNYISTFLEFKNFEYKKEFEGKKLRNIFGCWEIINKGYFFFSIFFWFLENYLIWFCVSTLSPNHCVIYRNISSTFYILRDLYNNKNKFISMTSIISLVWILICGLIFNEIIIIRVCKFDKNTAVELDKRQKEDFKTSFIEQGQEGEEESRNQISDVLSDASLGSSNNLNK